MKCWLYQPTLYGVAGKEFHDYSHCIWLSRQYPGNGVLFYVWVVVVFVCSFFFVWWVFVVVVVFWLNCEYSQNNTAWFSSSPNAYCPSTEPKLRQFCCDIKDDVQVRAGGRSAFQGAAVAGELRARRGQWCRQGQCCHWVQTCSSPVRWVVCLQWW